MIKILSKNIQAMEFSSILGNEKPSFVDTIRWEKMQALKSEKDKRRSLASAYLLNKMCEELGVRNPHYQYGEKGKPYLAGQEKVAFNLSHSGEYAALAYVANVDGSQDAGQQRVEEIVSKIGIDIQEIRPMKEGMKKRILNEKEKLDSSFSQEEETKYLNRIWCIKESYVKMLGVGLSLDFRKIAVDFAEGRVMADGYKSAYFSEDDHLPGYVMAVCCNKEVQVKILDC